MQGWRAPQSAFGRTVLLSAWVAGAWAAMQGLNTFPAIAPRPIVSNYAFQIPVLTAEAANVPLETG